MTLHRCLYKVLWKSKVLIPLIFVCALIAIVTTFFHGKFSEQSLPHSRIQPRYAREIDGQDVVSLHGGFQPYREKKVIQGYIADVKRKALDALQKNGILPTDVVKNRTASTRNKFKGWERKAKRPKQLFVAYHSNKLLYDNQKPPEIFSYWKESREPMCSGKFVGSFNDFAVLENVLFDRQFCHGRKGGEDIKDVLMQAEEDEYYTYEMGCMQLQCDERPSYFFNNKNHLNDLLFSLQTKDVRVNDVTERVDDGFTLLITRYEYANIYHTMTDWYNAFLLMNYFNKTQAETNILLLDGHPYGALDPVWPVLFNSSRRFSKLGQRTLYRQLTFNILGYNSPFLDHSTDTIPLIEEFSRFFLSSYRLAPKTTKLSCDTLSVLFIWRRDYLAHPRNPNGSVSRKIANERELLESLQRRYPAFHIKGVQIDLFAMQQQLQYVSEADVLIGMHGAGLTHALFLPLHAGVIEFIPNYWSAAMEHFLAIARWRQLKYERWVNADPHNEVPNQETVVPSQVLHVLFRSLMRQMGCAMAAATESNSTVHVVPGAVKR